MKAVIDLGTNTFHLLVAEISGDALREVFELQVPVKLGQGGINSGIIREEAFERGMQALSRFRSHLDRLAVKAVKAVATSAIRNAANGQEFIDAAASRYGIEITVIDGNAEALCIYEGVRHSFPFPDEPVLVMDIGGGSVELIIGIQDRVLWKRSFEVGAARLIAKFMSSDPPSYREISALKDHLAVELAPLADALAVHPVQSLVGSAGAFETLRDVVLKDIGRSLVPLSAHACEIRLEDVEAFSRLMVGTSPDEKRKLSGMVDFRVEMITAASLLMMHVISQLKAGRLIVSDYALKEGLMLARD